MWVLEISKWLLIMLQFRLLSNLYFTKQYCLLEHIWSYRLCCLILKVYFSIKNINICNEILSKCLKIFLYKSQKYFLKYLFFFLSGSLFSHATAVPMHLAPVTCFSKKPFCPSPNSLLRVPSLHFFFLFLSYKCKKFLEE